MLRSLALVLAILAVNSGSFMAETTPPTADCGDISNKVAHPQSNSVAAGSSGEDAVAENELFDAANKSRELEGVPALRMEASLVEAARAHARRMVAARQLEHQLPGEFPLLKRIGVASSLRMDRVGENIAYATCAPRANEVLMRSPPHRQNLLDSGYNIAGIAAIWSRGKLYVVQDFAHEVQSYTAEESGKLVGGAVEQTRQEAGLAEMERFAPPNLDKAACSLANEDHPNAHLLATAYDNRKIITYTQSRPEILPDAALRLLRDPQVGHFAVGSCYARNAAYPTGMYWVAILLY
jgi:uncharacterized protein YkwD